VQAATTSNVIASVSRKATAATSSVVRAVKEGGRGRSTVDSVTYLIIPPNFRDVEFQV
jgi:hypothetical protein